MPYHEQLGDISMKREPVQAPTIDEQGHANFEVEEILAHRKKGKGYQWLSLMKGDPRHDAEWQPTRDFIDDDGTITAKFHTYIVKHGLLPHLH